MKSKLLFAGLIALGLTSKAQFGEKGQRLITAGLGASHTLNNDNLSNDVKSSNLNFNISTGKFSKQNTLTNYGVFGGFFKNVNGNGSSTFENWGYNVGAAIGKTVYKPIVKNLFVGLGVVGNISYARSETTDSNHMAPLNIDKRYGASVGLVPSLAYQFSKRFVANLSTGNSFLRAEYSFGRTEQNATGAIPYKRKHQGFGLNAGFWSAPLSNLSIGFSYLLNKK